MKIKAALFDLDGTLLNTLDDLSDSMNAVLIKRGYPVHDVEEYKFFVGNGIFNLVVRSLPSGIDDRELIEQCYAQMKEEYNRRIIDKTKPYEGVREMLGGLIIRGIKISVLSNKRDENTKYIVSKLLPEYKFDAVFGERSGVPIKPDPAAALEISGILGTSPKEMLYLGDSGVDMKTANAAGMLPVGALWGFRGKDELLENGAKKIASSPLEVLKIVDGEL